MLEWLPRLRLKGSALPLSGSLGSVSFGAFFTCFMWEHERRRKIYFIGGWDFKPTQPKLGESKSFIYSCWLTITDTSNKISLTLFFILTKITIQMAMRINVTTTPTRTPSTGVICTRTARDDAENFKDIRFVVSGELGRSDVAWEN